MDSDATSSTSTSEMSPQKKRRRLDLGHLSVDEKLSLINMYKKFSTDVPKMNTSAIVNNISITAGVAKSTVYRIIREYKGSGYVMESKHSGGRPNLINTNIDYEYTKNFVRQIVHSYLSKNEIPTLDKILTELRNRQDLPQMSRSSLYTFMKKINLKFQKLKKNTLVNNDSDEINELSDEDKKIQH